MLFKWNMRTDLHCNYLTLLILKSNTQNQCWIILFNISTSCVFTGMKSCGRCLSRFQTLALEDSVLPTLIRRFLSSAPITTSSTMNISSIDIHDRSTPSSTSTEQENFMWPMKCVFWLSMMIWITGASLTSTWRPAAPTSSPTRGSRSLIN